MYEINSVKPPGSTRRTGTAAAGVLWAEGHSQVAAVCRPPGPSFLVRDRSGSYRTFLDDLREFISLRLDRVNPYRESREYCEEQEKASQLYERLRGMLPGEGRALLLEYSEALCAAYCLETAILAERAFLDGVRIAIRAMADENNVEF